MRHFSSKGMLVYVACGLVLWQLNVFRLIVIGSDNPCIWSDRELRLGRDFHIQLVVYFPPLSRFHLFVQHALDRAMQSESIFYCFIASDTAVLEEAQTFLQQLKLWGSVMKYFSRASIGDLQKTCSLSRAEFVFVWDVSFNINWNDVSRKISILRSNAMLDGITSRVRLQVGSQDRLLFRHIPSLFSMQFGSAVLVDATTSLTVLRTLLWRAGSVDFVVKCKDAALHTLLQASVQVWQHCMPPTLLFAHLREPVRITYVDLSDVQLGIPRSPALVPSVESFDKKSILIIHERLPCACMGGDLRVLQILEWLVSLQRFRITVWGREPAWEDRSQDEQHLKSIGVEYMYISMELSELESMVLDFDIAVIGTWFWRKDVDSIPEISIPFLRRAKRRITIVILSDDVHFIRDMQTGFMGDPVHLYTREMAVYRMADMVICISEQDRNFLQSLLPAKHFSVVPFTIDSLSSGLVDSGNEYTLDVRGGERKCILYVGDQHEANRKAVAFFLDFVLQFVPKTNVCINIVGASIWKEMIDQRGLYWIGTWGRVPSLNHFLKTAIVFINPVVVGGTGVSTKSFLPIAAGVPLVTTSMGAVGLKCVQLCKFLKIANDPADFAAAVMSVISDPQWSILSQAALQYTKEFLSWDVFLSEMPLVRLLVGEERPNEAIRSPK